MVKTCSEPGCTTLVMGGCCVDHDRLPMREFARGRPFVSSATTYTEAVIGGGDTGIAWSTRELQAGFEHPR